MSQFKKFLLSFPTFAWVNQKLNKFLTAGGKVVFLSTFFFAAGATHLDTPVYLLCGASVSVLFISFVTARFLRPKLITRSQLPELMIAGERASYCLQISNYGKYAAYELDVFAADANAPGVFTPTTSDRPKRVSSVLPSSANTISLPIMASQRGRFEGPALSIRSAFPFNLVHCTDRHQGSGTVHVIPSFRELVTSHFISTYESKKSGNIDNSRAFADQEFVGSREYTPGLDVKRWDYAAWARHQTPYVCQYDDEGFQNAALVFDDTQKRIQETEFESAISLLLSITKKLIDHDYSIRYLIIGNQVHELTRRQTPQQQFNEIGKHLANCQARTTDPNRKRPTEILADMLIVHVSTNPLAFQQDSHDIATFDSVHDFRVFVCGTAATDLAEPFHRVSVKEISEGAVRL